MKYQILDNQGQEIGVVDSWGYACSVIEQAQKAGELSLGEGEIIEVEEEVLTLEHLINEMRKRDGER